MPPFPPWTVSVGFRKRQLSASWHLCGGRRPGGYLVRYCTREHVCIGENMDYRPFDVLRGEILMLFSILKSMCLLKTLPSTIKCSLQHCVWTGGNWPLSRNLLVFKKPVIISKWFDILVVCTLQFRIWLLCLHPQQTFKSLCTNVLTCAYLCSSGWLKYALSHLNN